MGRGSVCCDIFYERGSLDQEKRTNDVKGTGKSSYEIPYYYYLVTPV